MGCLMAPWLATQVMAGAMSGVLEIAPGLIVQGGPISQAGAVFRGSPPSADRRQLCPRGPEHQSHHKPIRIL